MDQGRNPFQAQMMGPFGFTSQPNYNQQASAASHHSIQLPMQTTEKKKRNRKNQE